jgi:hypothetical protein
MSTPSSLFFVNSCGVSVHGKLTLVAARSTRYNPNLVLIESNASSFRHSPSILLVIPKRTSRAFDSTNRIATCLQCLWTVDSPRVGVYASVANDSKNTLSSSYRYHKRRTLDLVQWSTWGYVVRSCRIDATSVAAATEATFITCSREGFR